MGQLRTPRRFVSSAAAGSSTPRPGTLDRKPAAAAWLKKREGELAQPGALDRFAPPLRRSPMSSTNISRRPGNR